MSEQMPPGRLIASPALRARIYLGESDHSGGRSLYSAFVDAARRAGIAGITVFKGIEGYGARSVVHAAHIVDLSSDLPIVVEIVNEPVRLRAFISTCIEMLEDGLVTYDEVEVAFCAAGRPRA